MIDTARWGLVYLLLIAEALARPPVLEGKATRYWDCVDSRCLMTNGQKFDPNKMTTAVPEGAPLGGLWFVCAECTQNGNTCTLSRCIIVQVTDTGWLYQPEHGIDVALDLSPRAFRALRDVGGPGDNDGCLEVQAWEVR